MFCLISFLLSIIVTYLYRINRVEKQKKVLEQEVVKRTAEIMEQKEEIMGQSIKLEIQAHKLQSLNHNKDKLFGSGS